MKNKDRLRKKYFLIRKKKYFDIKPSFFLPLIKLIEKKFNKKVKQKFYPLQMGDIIKTEANIKDEQKKFKFKFKVNIEKGIDNFSKWFLNEK